MNPLLSRRGTLKMLLGGAAFGAQRQPGWAQAPLATTKLADNFTLITGGGANVLLLTAPDGCLLVDGGSPQRSADVLKQVAQLSGNKPVKVLLNTHWHYDSTGSNEALGKAGAKIIAHENTRLWLSTEIDQQWTKTEYKPLPKIAQPNETFYTAGKLDFAGQPVEYGYELQAHTDGDIYIHFPIANILMVGDMVQPGRFPVLDWTTAGWITGMVDAQKALLAIARPETKIVPATGNPITKADLQHSFERLTELRDAYLKAFRQGKSPQEMLNEGLAKPWEAEWGDPKQFLDTAYRGMWGHVREIGGIV